MRGASFLRLLLPAVCAVAIVVGPAAARPSPPKLLSAIFFYPWFGTPERDGSYGHWAVEGHSPPDDLASSYYPMRGAYSSSDPAVLSAQMGEIAAAGVDEIIVSWWGWGSPEDLRLEMIQRAAERARLVVAVHLEPYEGRTVESVEADIAHLETLGIRDFYVYRPFETAPAADWAAMNDRLADVRTFAQTPFAGLAAAGHFDGLYTYDVLTYDGGTFRRLCNQAHVAGLLCAPSVGPGYDARRASADDRVKGRRNGTTYDAMWAAAVASGADQVTITSYNEWGEGTQIEPARPAVRVRGFVYGSYTGAWGMRGARSSRAYLARTAYWTARFAARAG
jgi:hypothetical protein